MSVVGVVSFWHETNEYSARRPDLPQWVEYELLSGSDILTAHQGTRSVVGGFIDALGARAVPIFAAGAWPAGAASAEVVDDLLSRLSDAVRDAGGLDAIALNLHGAMVAEGMPDVELEVVRRIREVYPDIPIAAVMDFHGNPSVEVTAAVQALVSYQTYPHIDMWECGVEAVRLVDLMLGGERLATSIVKLPLLTSPLAQGTETGPLGKVLSWMNAEAARLGLLRVSVMGGFAYQDNTRVGVSLLAVATVDRRQAAEALVDAAATRVLKAQSDGAFAVIRPRAAEAVRTALESPDFPVILADVADNIGGGSAGDGTVILAELLAQGARDSLVVVADREVARASHDAGVGAEISVAVGGKTDSLHGDPLPIVGTVRVLSDGVYRSHGSWGTGQSFAMGLTAVLDVGGNTLVVTERATPPFHREQVTSVGVDPARARIIVAKGAIAWKAAFGDIAKTVIEVDSPGACPLDPWQLPRSSKPVTVSPAVTPALLPVVGRRT